MKSSRKKDTEIRSLLLLIWKAVQNLSIPERLAFLLHKPEFLIEFVVFKCCTTNEIIEYLALTEVELKGILKELPVPDEKIILLLESGVNEKVSLSELHEIRAESKRKLLKALTSFLNY